MTENRQLQLYVPILSLRVIVCCSSSLLPSLTLTTLSSINNTLLSNQLIHPTKQPTLTTYYLLTSPNNTQPSSMPTPQETSWQDRRGMFQRGKEVHQPGRKLSNQFGDPLGARRTSTGSTGGGGLEKTNSVEEPGASSRRRVSLPLFFFRCGFEMRMGEGGCKRMSSN